MRSNIFVPVFLFLVLWSVSAFAYPEVGHQFYGYADSGSTVTATVGDLTYTTSVQSDYYYGYDDLFFVDAASDDVGGAEEGDTITFYLDGTEITTATFEVGGVSKVDFADDPATSDDESSSLSTSSSSNTSSSSSSSSSDDDDDSSSSDSSSRKKSSSSSSDDDEESCTHKWSCKSWGVCAENGFQTRICYYTGNCTTEGNQSDTRQRCTYVASEEEVVVEEEEETCDDNVKNQGERGIDCGGPCDACPTTTAPPVVEETKTNWLYIGLGIFLILLIIAVILAHKYKDKLQPWWDKIRGKKPVVGTIAATAAKPATATLRPMYQQQYQYRSVQQSVKK